MCGLAVLGLVVPRCVSQQFSFSDVSDGLGDLNVNCLAQDQSGYLWVGTENGLYRYDGSLFQQYGSSDGLAEHTIQSLFLGLDGTLWVGTTSSIYFRLPNGRFAAVSAPAPVNQFSHRIGTVFTAVSANEVITADRSGAFLLRHVEPERWAAEPMPLKATQFGACNMSRNQLKGRDTRATEAFCGMAAIWICAGWRVERPRGWLPRFIFPTDRGTICCLPGTATFGCVAPGMSAN